MTVLHIDEYSSKVQPLIKSRGRSPDTVHAARVLTQAQITVDGTNKVSAAVNGSTAYISIRPIGGNVYVEIGSAPVASATTKLLVDGEYYEIAVTTGDKVAVTNA